MSIVNEIEANAAPPIPATKSLFEGVPSIIYSLRVQRAEVNKNGATADTSLLQPNRSRV